MTDCLAPSLPRGLGRRPRRWRRRGRNAVLGGVERRGGGVRWLRIRRGRSGLLDARALRPRLKSRLLPVADRARLE